jgi:hypothetical protein
VNSQRLRRRRRASLISASVSAADGGLIVVLGMALLPYEDPVPGTRRYETWVMMSARSSGW